MGTRVALNSELEKIIPHVYFQPPESLKIAYPCIIYNRSDIQTDYADNRTYKNVVRYQVTLIDKNPDTPFIQKLLDHFQMISFDRHFTSDHLNHEVFTLYY